jgi:4a-hydroxytetrahydrobiopterin dehydratase
MYNTQRQLCKYDMTQLLTEAEITQQAETLFDWTVDDGKKLICSLKFTNFIQAVEFVNQLVEPAESAGHHPDIQICYNTVNIQLTTHDAGGLTQKDFDLAKVISAIASGAAPHSTH